MLLNLDPILLEAVIRSTADGMALAGINPSPVGASRYPTSRARISVLVGLVGKCSGTLTTSISERGFLYLCSRVLGEDVTVVSEDSIDGMMEIGNIIAGSLKQALLGSPFEVQHISLPSIVMGGQGCEVIYAKGMSAVSVTFEITDMGSFNVEERFFTTSLSLLRGSGSGG